MYVVEYNTQSSAYDVTESTVNRLQSHLTLETLIISCVVTGDTTEPSVCSPGGRALRGVVLHGLAFEGPISRLSVHVEGAHGLLSSDRYIGAGMIYILAF